MFYHLRYVGCNKADLTGQSGTLNTSRCGNRGFVNSSTISNGVVCYNETTAGSRAIYICNDGFNLMGTEARFCQSDGSWNGTIPLCIQEVPGILFSAISISVRFQIGHSCIINQLFKLRCLNSLLCLNCVGTWQSYSANTSNHQAWDTYTGAHRDQHWQ